MADDRMKNDDLDKNMGAGSEKEYGKQSPGRSKQDDEDFGQRGGGQGSTGREMEDDDRQSDRGGRGGQSGGRQGQGQGGQNR